ncbi:MAG TPA: type II toxin-antitoxin system VapC family toxin [Solirubrobacterales bacterium]|nr:type II toxin-antitoxin system VapC family toxin [Solirubrobacterales bacterium]
MNRTDVFLLDASVWIAAKDASDRYCSVARPLVVDSDLPVSALDLTVYEVANVVGTRWRQLDAAGQLIRTIASRCGDRLVRVDSALVESALDVAAEHGLTAYDATYVAAARRHGMTLVSADIADLVSKGLAVAPDDADYP